jgi:hypothetical protein
MTPRMSNAELSLFKSFLRCSTGYVEFGSGGSTCLASEMAKGAITSVDSSKDWQNKVREICPADLVYVDIGPVGEWGYPTDPTTEPSWPAYYETIWDRCPVSFDADLYLVDGRFRVACVMSILLHCRPDAVIMVHDFASRKHYHPIREVAREIAVAEDLSVFIPAPLQSREKIYGNCSPPSRKHRNHIYQRVKHPGRQ